ncbi:deleted in malignant brain tumors 1 protein-like [Lytechinus variegatus]|uniref:deleted in malignant brain tumors 1 protein-like n=1 Tax=Lytechinus variegatus TaxID=7654 RepID=UPI001BB195FD|nr:deleted in malignant brain tumors 1 protein-like [Lytechinus variegatus]
MLGFDGALEAPRSARFGQGSGRVLLMHVNCEGTENNLADCAHAGIARYPCMHSRDAGAVCHSGEPFSIHLINGANDFEGRVKILYEGGMGTICDDDWDIRDARVVCNMLGFDGALAAPGSATFGTGSGEILLDDVDCKGTENSLADCLHRGLGVNNCNHDSDAGVVCFTRDQSSPFQLRLTGGGSNVEGTVNVMHNGSWGTVCDLNWDLRDARVVCRMLGFDGALEAPIAARFGRGSGRVLLNWVECDGSEDNLADCIHPGVGDYTYCGHNKDAGVMCFIEVRLADGASENEGRVEILHEGSWGTVCDDLWDLDDATVVCRHLGFEGALAALPQAHFGVGSGEFFLDGVQCNGSEANLKDCNHSGIGVHDCAHKEDASVICRNTGFTTYSDDSTSDEMHSTNTLYLKSSTSIGYETTDTTGNKSTDYSTPRRPLHINIGQNLETNSGAAIELSLHMIIVTGICTLFLSIFLILSIVYCVYRFNKRMAARNSDDIYMDVTNLSSLNALSTSSTNQDLHAPPQLPDRQKTDVIRHEYESQITMDLVGNADNLETIQNIHEYTDMKTIRQTHQRNEYKDFDGYCRPDTDMPSRDVKSIENCSKTEMLKLSDDNVGIEFSPKGKNENLAHDYMDMKTIYQKPKSGEDLDLNGYLLPDATNSPFTESWQCCRI